MCYPLSKLQIQIFYTPKAQNGGELPHNTHFPKSSIIILYSGDLILNIINLTLDLPHHNVVGLVPFVLFVTIQL